MIFFNKVTKKYPPHKNKAEKTVLKDITFRVEEGEFTSIVGRSGAGKTTLLQLISGEKKPTEGEVFFNDEKINDISERKLYKVRKRIGTIFQDYKLLPSKTVYENVAYAMEVTGISEEEIEKDVPEVLDIVGIIDQSQQFPKELSGGEKQRVAIARALIHQPDIILADEPTGDLDPYHTREILNLLLEINRMDTTVILATHDKEVVNSIGKRVITLQDSKIVSDIKEGRFRL